MRELQKINTSNLTLGMRFSAPVFFDDGENMFLAEGKPIREYHLDALQRWKQTYVVTYGQVVSDNALPSSSAASDDVEDLEVLEELEEVESLEPLEELENVDLPEAPDYTAGSPLVYRTGEKNPESFDLIYQKNISILKRFFNSYEHGEVISRATIDQAYSSISEALKDDMQGVVTWILNKGSGSTYAERAVDGAFLCGAVASRLSVMPRKIAQIEQAALIHDIAMVQVPEHIRNKNTKLTNDEFELLKMHTVRSGRICNDQLLFPREVTDIVTSHHERWDGSGYPEGRKGNEIDIGARILAVVDAFEAMTSEKSYRDPISGYETVKQLLQDSGSAFDSMVIKAFVQTLGVYPMGSYVQLSDGAVCKVVGTNDDSLFLPSVSIVKNGTGPTARMEQGTVIELNKQRQLFVAKAVDNPF